MGIYDNVGNLSICIVLALLVKSAEVTGVLLRSLLQTRHVGH